jgi:hypothetical protein
VRSASLAVALPAILAAGLVVCANACSSEASAPSTPAPDASVKVPERDASVVTPVDAGKADSGGTVTQGGQFTGTLEATEPAAFGGGGACSYRITMKSVSVDVTVTETGTIERGASTSTAVEEIEVTTPPCPDPPLEANLHKYTFTSASQLPGGGMHLEFAPGAANKPQATLVLEGDFSGPTVDALLEWHRTDLGAPYEWRVQGNVTLAKH